MARKRSLDEADPASADLEARKKPKRGFQVGPANLPDGPWRRKVTKIKKELIHKAKVKKAFAKQQARDQREADNTIRPHLPSSLAQYPSLSKPGADDDAATSEAGPVHPERQALLDDDDDGVDDDGSDVDDHPPTRARGARDVQPTSPTTRDRPSANKACRPAYFDKQVKQAEQRREAAEARRLEAEQRAEERQRKLEERQRYRRAMGKARKGGKDGKRKLGRESTILLEKVRRLVGDKG